MNSHNHSYSCRQHQEKLKEGRQKFSLSIAIISFMLLCTTAHAELSLNGSAIYKDLGKQQFVAALYLDTKNNNANSIQLAQSPKRMEVKILNNYSKRRWLNLWMQSISINNDRESFSGSAQEVIDMMQAPKSAPQRGDIIEYRFDPRQGTSVVFNGTELISNYPGEVFNILLRTWIGPIPPTTSFKEQLLGNSTDSTAEALLETIEPQPKRIILAASWMAPPKPVLPATPDPAPEPAPTQVLAKVEEVAPALASEQNPTESSSTESDKIVGTGEPEEAESAEGTESAGEQEEEAIDFNVAEALAQRDYTPLVVSQIYKSISYPNRAAEKNQQGTVRIAVIINRSGELLDTVTTQESKYRLLNQAALKAVKKAAPFPELPAEIKSDSFELNLPITFRLK